MSIPSRVFSRSGFRAPSGRRAAFTLVELLTVMGFMSLLVAVTVPAVNGLKGSGDFTRGVDEVELALTQARTHAMSRNTYVWVGFYEESASGGVSSAQPPFSGKGQVVLATVASVDGTRIFEDDAAAATLPSDRLRPVGRLQKISRLHLADVGGPVGTGDSRHLDARPDAPYVGDEADTSRISSESALKTPFPFQVGTYTFYKTVRFSPSGEATINGSATPKRLGEIGLLPAAGDQVAADSANAAAVQFSGMGGDIRAYRR